MLRHKLILLKNSKTWQTRGHLLQLSKKPLMMQKIRWSTAELTPARTGILILGRWTSLLIIVPLQFVDCILQANADLQKAQDGVKAAQASFDNAKNKANNALNQAQNNFNAAQAKFTQAVNTANSALNQAQNQVNSVSIGRSRAAGCVGNPYTLFSDTAFSFHCRHNRPMMMLTTKPTVPSKMPRINTMAA